MIILCVIRVNMTIFSQKVGGVQISTSCGPQDEKSKDFEKIMFDKSGERLYNI